VLNARGEMEEKEKARHGPVRARSPGVKMRATFCPRPPAACDEVWACSSPATMFGAQLVLFPTRREIAAATRHIRAAACLPILYTVPKSAQQPTPPAEVQAVFR